MSDRTWTLTWEYRDVGEHDYRAGVCVHFACRNATHAVGARCPTKRERRLVGTWEPVPSADERTQGDG